MNYAEDRLDRKAQHQKHNNNNNNNNNNDDIKQPNQVDADNRFNPLQNDLIQGHQQLHSCILDIDIDIDIDVDSNNFQCQTQTLCKLKQSHSLLGKTLRDYGFCRHATFHFALAWMCDLNDELAAGDYAQMAELAGYPEVGILSLLFYHHGGIVDCNHALILSKTFTRDQKQSPNTILDESSSFHHSSHCGCGIDQCGRKPCFIIPSMIQSPILQNIIHSLSTLEEYALRHSIEQYGDAATINAADLLQFISKTIPKNTYNQPPGDLDIHLQYSFSKYLYFGQNLKESFHSLHFWTNLICNNSTHNAHDIEATIRNNIKKSSHTKQQYRDLPPLLQILLLKLLYCCSGSPSFLILACEATPHLSIQMPSSSNIGKMMARQFKSHWAYFTFIKELILGQPVKKSRRHYIVPYHVPVWDILHGLDQRKKCSSIHEISKMTHASKDSPILLKNYEDNKRDHSSLSSYLNNLINNLQLDLDETNHFKYRCTYLPHSSQLQLQLQLRPMFFIGDSHVLSIGWQTLCIPRVCDENIYRTIIPLPVTGLKAWHVRKDTRFFTYYNLRTVLSRLPSDCSTIVLSAGEIDCREGIGGSTLSGYYNSCDEAVQNTVNEYLLSVTEIAYEFKVQILLMPVAPHAYRSEKNGKAKGRACRRKLMFLWNSLLRQALAESSGRGKKYDGVYLLDYEEELRMNDVTSPVGFVLNKVYNADFTHMNSAFLALLEDSIERCGCNLDLV